MDPVNKKTIGLWSVSIYADCPHCDECVDIANGDNFWTDASELKIADPGPIEAECPNCSQMIENIHLLW